MWTVLARTRLHGKLPRAADAPSRLSRQAIAKARESRARTHDLKAAELARDAASSRPGTGLSRRPKTPMFLTRDEGVMCVSPVSPSSPMSPGTFLSNVMKKKR